MIKILADIHIPFLKGALEPFCDMRYLPGDSIRNNDLQDIDGLIIRTRTLVNHALIRDTPVQFIASATIGYDHIDTECCSSGNIRWTSAPGCNADSVTQYLASSLIYLHRKFKIEPKNLIMGIIGVGHVGSKVEKMARAMGMKIMLNDPPRARKEGHESFFDLEEVQAKADIISMHVPLNHTGIDKTFHMADSAFIKKAGRPFIFLNTSRGQVMDTKAIIDGVKSQKIRGAVFDVWENEPTINIDLLELSSLGTPHIAGYSVEGKANGTAMVVNATSRHFGFGLTAWYPDRLPGPFSGDIDINNRNKTIIEVLGEAILASYTVENDSENLKSAPRNFETFRNHYPARREPGFYTVRLKEPSDEIYELLRTIGFNTY